MRNDKDEILGQCRMGDRMTIDCKEEMDVIIRTSLLDKKRQHICPGEKYRIDYNGFGTPHWVKIDTII